MGRRRRIKEKVVPRMPSRQEMAENKWLAPIAHRFLTPELWRFTRRSVPRGVALGLFSAFIIPLGQIFLAAFLALPARANVPLAVIVTFVTNPFTIPFWLIAANRVGTFFLRIDTSRHSETLGRDISSGTFQEFSWFFQAAGATAVGFVLLALVSAAVGYLIASLFWRYWVGRKLRVRREMRTPGESDEA